MASVTWLQKTRQAVAAIENAEHETEALQGFLDLDNVWKELKVTAMSQQFCKEMIRLDFIHVFLNQNMNEARVILEMFLGMIFGMTNIS